MKKTYSILQLITVLAGVFAMGIPQLRAGTYSYGSDDIRLFIDAQTIARGYTLRKPTGDFVLGIFPHVLDRVATVTVRDVGADGVGNLEGWNRISDIFEFDILTDPIKIFGKEVIFQVKYTSDSTKTKRLFFWDRNWQQWRPLRSVNLLNDRMVRAFTHLPYSKVAVFEQDTTREGLASWYRDSRTYTASSNDFEIGSSVRVTNVENGASIVVRIVSTGPFVAGRVIDLERTAFSKIADPLTGLAKVVVEPTDATTGSSTSPQVTTSDAPSITGKTAIIWDPKNNTVIYDKDADTPRSIASISKLMTALVFLETNPDWDRVMTIAPEDTPTPIAGVTIAVGTGETITVRDLFEAMLTGSANNAAYAVARSTGLPRDAFVARMNDLARRLGMTNAHFEEPSGLSEHNTASARDVAKLVEYASHRFGLAQATLHATDSYTKLNTGEVRTIRNPIYLAPGLHDKPLLIGKTGYIDEALYTLGVKARNGNGDERVVVVLGSSSKTSRNSDVARLITWSLP